MHTGREKERMIVTSGNLKQRKLAELNLNPFLGEPSFENSAI